MKYIILYFQALLALSNAYIDECEAKGADTGIEEEWRTSSTRRSLRIY